MFASIPIGKIFGVTVRVHLLLLVFVLFLLSTPWSIADLSLTEKLFLLGILAGSILLHELGHSLVAKKHNIEVLDITFWPLGGMSRFAQFPTNPTLELRIALAGPAVNLLLALLLLPLVGAQASWAKLAFGMNLYLGLFNLLPAFPMDGARILRALLGFRANRLQATTQAVRVGKYLAFALALFALFATSIDGPTKFVLLILAVFIWFSGMQELWAARLKNFFQPNAPPPSQPSSPEEHSDQTIENLETFKGNLSEYFKQEKDQDDS